MLRRNGAAHGFLNLWKLPPMSVLALSLNHHSAPLDLRGRFAFRAEQLAPALHSLRRHLQHCLLYTSLRARRKRLFTLFIF